MTQNELLQEGYLYPRQLPDGRWIGLLQMLYTTGLFVELDAVGYAGRYCFELYSEALFSLIQWNGEGDPPGNWIKWKGRGGDRHNPNWRPDIVV